MSKIITIAGDLGSGKSSVAKKLSNILGYKFVSSGDIFRKVASIKDVSVMELNKIAHVNTSIDENIDSYLKSLNDSTDDLVVDSRLAWFFIPKSIKFYFTVDPNIAGSRILKDRDRVVERYGSLQEAIKQISKRKKRKIEGFSVSTV